MPTLDPRQKAERIVELFRSRQPIEILPAELYPARSRRGLRDPARLSGDRGGEGPGRDRRLQDRADDAGHAEALRHRRALLRRDLRARGPSSPRRACSRATIAGSGSRPRSPFGWATTCRKAAIRDGIAAAVESCMAAIELIEDLRYDYTRLDAAAMVAGNVWNAGVVLGTPVTDWRALRPGAGLRRGSRSMGTRSAAGTAAM